MNLNHQQKVAVEFYGTPQVIIAGAGTGKTTVMIEKIRYLIKVKGVHPSSILALTFTNKAANELKNRFKGLNNLDKNTPFFGTFHSFCLKHLLASPKLACVGLSNSFGIADSQQQKEVVQAIIKSKKLSILDPPKSIISKLSLIKQCPHHDHEQLLLNESEQIKVLFHEYNAYLRQMGCVDFDDLLLHMVYILNTQKDELDKIQKKYEYIIVDEYQDTNKIQNELCMLLAREHQHICVVGDFDQTIYSWRGANVENLLKFDERFSNATVQKLEINYRSTTEILGAANQLISHNSQRLPKQLTSDRSSGNKIDHVICYDEREEVEFIVNKIKQYQKDDKYPLSSFAILYRTNQQSRAIEETLNYHNLPHQIVGAVPFYQRVEVKSAIAYLQCLNNINQAFWFERALLNPARGIGKTSIRKLIEYSIQNNMTLYDAVYSEECPVKERYLETIKSFCCFMISMAKKSMTIDEKLTEILDFLSFDSYLKKLGNYDDRKNNIKEFISKCKTVTNLNDFLNEFALFQDVENKDNSEKIQCMTLHLSKGLEFPIVFIPGFEDHLLPLKHTNSLEEERRLAYVGITRGKQQVILLSAYKRFLMGDDLYHDPSVFSKELNGAISYKMTKKINLLAKPILFKMSQYGIDDVDIVASENSEVIIDAVGETFQVFESGDQVFHSSLGTGIIESKMGDGDDLMYSVSFPSGRKTLMAKFALLKHAE